MLTYRRSVRLGLGIESGCLVNKPQRRQRKSSKSAENNRDEWGLVKRQEGMLLVPHALLCLHLVRYIQLSGALDRWHMWEKKQSCCHICFMPTLSEIDCLRERNDLGNERHECMSNAGLPPLLIRPLFCAPLLRPRALSLCSGDEGKLEVARIERNPCVQ